MIISAYLVKEPRETRLCAVCDKTILSRCVRLFGSAHGGRRESKSVIWQHWDCCSHHVQVLAEQTVVDHNAKMRAKRSPKQLTIDFEEVPF